MSHPIQPLYNAEILYNIISFNSQNDATRYARVCKAWLDVALDHVWWEVRGFKALFNILAPLVPPGEGESVNKPLIFSRPIGTDDWNRLSKFTRRVRSFTIGEEDGVVSTKARLDDSVFLKALATRTTIPLLPNLQHLIVGTMQCAFAQVEVLLCVLTGRLKYLTMQIWNSSVVEDVVHFMKEAACRAPNIQEICFSDACTRPVISPFARDIFPRFLHLETLSLSSCALDAMMLSALSHAPSLKRIKLYGWGGNGRTADTKNIHTAQLAPTLSQFPELNNLSLQSRIPDITAFLSKLHCLKNLVSLRLDSISASLGDDISNLLQTLSSSCKKLRLLRISRNEDFSKDPTEVAERKSITYAVLEHLCRLPALRTFFLSHIQPLDISNQELADIIHSCKRLKHFSLHRDPSVCTNGKSGLTLDFLDELFARKTTTRLEHLLLEVDTSVIPQPHPQTADTRTFTIRNLNFGYSLLKRTDTSKVAAYLDSVISTSCKLSNDTMNIMSKRKEVSLGKLRFDALETRKDAWSIVGESLDLLCAARRRNTQETLLLQRTISDLRRELKEVSQDSFNEEKREVQLQRSPSPSTDHSDILGGR